MKHVLLTILSNVTSLTQLIETILKNVPGAIAIWGKREYQEVVVATVCNTKFMRARESLLELIQALGIAYAADKSVCFSQAYTELLTRHRVSFPPPNKQPFVPPTEKVSTGSGANKSPRHHGPDLTRSARRHRDEIDIYDPTGIFSEETHRDYETVKSTPSKRSGRSQRREKDASIEDQLDAVSSSISLLNDIIDNLGEGEKIEGNELIATILPSIEKTADTIIRIIQSDDTGNEELTARLFSANDAITEALSRYDAAKKGRKVPPKIAVSTPAPNAPPKPTPTQPQASDPFDDEFAMLASRGRPQTKSYAAAGGPPLADLLAFPSNHTFGAQQQAQSPFFPPPTNTASSPVNSAPIFGASPTSTNAFESFGLSSPSNSFASLSIQPPSNTTPAQTSAFNFDFLTPLQPSQSNPAIQPPAPGSASNGSTSNGSSHSYNGDSLI